MAVTQKPHSGFDLAAAQQRDRSQMSRGDMSLAMDSAYGEIKRLLEQFDSLHRTFEKWADEWDATGTAEVYGPDMARWMRDKWREALNPASIPLTTTTDERR